jgi:hypothetical protein
MTFDEAQHQIVLIAQGGQTWTWDGSDWTQQHPVRVPPWPSRPTDWHGLPSTAVAYDPGIGETVYVDTATPSTWLWDGNNWNPVQSGRQPDKPGVLAYSIQQQRLLFYVPATVSTNNLWAFDGRTWADAGTLNLRHAQF